MIKDIKAGVYNKALIALVGAVLTAIGTAVGNGAGTQATVYAAIQALVTAGAVWYVPNTPKENANVQPQQGKE